MLPTGVRDFPIVYPNILKFGQAKFSEMPVIFDYLKMLVFFIVAYDLDSVDKGL